MCTHIYMYIIYTYIYIYPPPCPCGTKWSVLGYFTGFGLGKQVPWGLGKQVPQGLGKLGKQDPKGTSREPPPPARFSRTLSHGRFRGYFFDIVLRPQFSQFWCQLESNLAPTWRQNRPKIVPRGLQIPTQIASGFRCPFGSIFDPICQIG